MEKIYLVRTRTETFKGTQQECEAWMIERRFPLFGDDFWERADASVAEWPGRPGELPEITAEKGVE